MAKAGRGNKPLNKNKKGKGKAGSKWGHDFTPKNAVARQLKNKTYRSKKAPSRRKTTGRMA